mmetsp:Transcript_47456/g.125078  ORF Transcript_47456/g.125078 Transcript_47456/m.125078 type:complete len:251 (-) Transcript_47456:5251-6003(-)
MRRDAARSEPPRRRLAAASIGSPRGAVDRPSCHLGFAAAQVQDQHVPACPCSMSGPPPIGSAASPALLFIPSTASRATGGSASEAQADRKLAHFFSCEVIEHALSRFAADVDSPSSHRDPSSDELFSTRRSPNPIDEMVLTFSCRIFQHVCDRVSIEHDSSSSAAAALPTRRYVDSSTREVPVGTLGEFSEEEISPAARQRACRVFDASVASDPCLSDGCFSDGVFAGLSTEGRESESRSIQVQSSRSPL